MAPDSDRQPDATLLAELDELARHAIPPMTPARERQGFAAVSARLAARGRRPRVVRRLGILGMAGAAAASVLYLGVARDRPSAPRPLSYFAESGEILAGGYLRATGDQGMSLRFSEGTRLLLSAGARGRLRQVDAEGGHLAVEQGPARVEVAERPGAHWVVDAGPFVITVKGTVFSVAWDVKTEALDLRMEKGLVAVSGPVLENVLAVRAGQRLSINLPKKEVVLHELEGDGVASSPQAAPRPARDVGKPARVSTAAAAPPAGRSANRAARGEARLALRASSPVQGSYGWAAILAAGVADSILGDVERVGAKRALAEASSDDLSALADAARYRRQEDLARQALLAQRARFPGSARACDAAFLLGRLEEAHEGRGRKALEWYEQYLEGAPTGAYASEALGRKMIATQKLTGKAAARAVAEDYLARFPSGSYAGAARALRQTP